MPDTTRPMSGLVRGGSALASILLAVLALGCESTPGESGAIPLAPAPEVREIDRAFHARRILFDARMFRREGRLEAAERALQRGLRVSPDDPRLNRMMGEVMGELGREGGDVYLRRADEIAPPPPPLPGLPLDTPGENVMVVLVPPDPDDVATRLTSSSWPDDEVAAALERRLAIRLPAASVIYADPETVDAARSGLHEGAPRAVISLRVERAYCGDTLKDGRFAVGQLRVAAERRGARADESGPATSREVVSEPRLAIGCRIESIARALEAAFSLPSVVRSLRSEDPGDRRSATDWPTAAVSSLLKTAFEK